MPKLPVTVLLTITLSLSAPLVQAANMSFLADQAMSRFTTQDAALFSDAATAALKAKNGTVISWKNPETKAFGTLTPYADPEKKSDCRIVRIMNVAENVKSSGYYRFCKSADGSWPPVMPPRQ